MEIIVNVRGMDPSTGWMWRNFRVQLDNYDIDYDRAMVEFGEPPSPMLRLLASMEEDPSSYILIPGKISLPQLEAVICRTVSYVIVELAKVAKDKELIERLNKFSDVIDRIFKYWTTKDFRNIPLSKMRAWRSIRQIVEEEADQTVTTKMQTAYYRACVERIGLMVKDLAEDASRAPELLSPAPLKSPFTNLVDRFYGLIGSVMTRMRLADSILRKIGRKKLITYQLDHDVLKDGYYSGVIVSWEDSFPGLWGGVSKKDIRNLLSIVVDAIEELQQTGFIKGRINIYGELIHSGA